MTRAHPEPFERLSAPPRHASYLRHRRELLWQVILPVTLAALLLIGLIVWLSLAAAGGEGDMARWAAISTIWIVLPVIAVGVAALIVLLGLIYLIGLLLHVTPAYTGIAQDYAYRVEAIVKRLTNAAVKPVFFFDYWSAHVKALFGRK